MYAIKPIIDSTNTISDLPSTMYKMKSIYQVDTTNNNTASSFADVSSSYFWQKSSTSPSKIPCKTTNMNTTTINSHQMPLNQSIISLQIDKLLKKITDSEMASLELRQEAVLEQLKQLKSRLMTMHAELGICAKPAQKPIQPNSSSVSCNKTTPVKQQQSAIQKKPINAAKLQDLVINANPNCIPYSLHALQTLWHGRLNLFVETFTHSTISELPKSVLDFTDSLTIGNNSSSDLPSLNITLIWKQVSQTELISAATNYLPIYGEVNILRYLNRIGPNEYAYEMSSVSQSLIVDATLDVCAQLIQSPIGQRRQQWLKDLTTKLGKQEYFGGNCLALSDIAASSIVKQITDVCPPPLKIWLQRVTIAVGY